MKELNKETAGIDYLLPGEKGPSGPVKNTSVIQKPNKKKQKRMEKFIESQLKKERRIVLHEKLSKQKFKSDLFQSSKAFGKKLSMKERVKRAYQSNLILDIWKKRME